MIGFKVDTAHIVPGEIDLDQFNDALARTLQAYPVHAGRIVRPRDPKDPWTVSLINQGVPVTVMESDADTEVPANAVIQSPKFPYTKPISVVKYLDFDNDEPLLRATIVRFTKTGSTSIGLCSAHIIGDGFVVLSFLRLLSQNYQGLEPLDPPPSYAAPPRLPFNAADYGEIPYPDYQHLYPLRGVAPHVEPGRKKPLRLDLRLTAAQIAAIHKGVLAQCPESSPPILSRQDVLVALVAYCLSKADPQAPPIQHISTILMSRGIPPRPKNSVGNALMWAMTEAAEDFEKETVFSIALRIRKALVQCRDPAYAAAYDAAHEPLAIDAINSEMAQDFIQRPGYMVVNSTWRFDWTSAHFGFPDQTRFCHTVLNEPRFLKMFRPNPTRRPDGTWDVRPKDDVEMIFYVHKEIRSAVMDLFASEANKLGMTGDVEWVVVQ
ncbi:transferase family-like protein [Phanerochaete sordida]|uniref:Transferase family-like protein n=1 Tax=Phanerochaete sordida TaxID=48140 RepID=A0A9P3L7V9_9APHY|nr:transferase family-like protein [Phanerochaete sordida]